MEEGTLPDSEAPRELKLDAIWQSLLEEFKIVEIVLEEGDDAQVIFETLVTTSRVVPARDVARSRIMRWASSP
jgi:hypothetical protein